MPPRSCKPWGLSCSTTHPLPPRFPARGRLHHHWPPSPTFPARLVVLHALSTFPIGPCSALVHLCKQSWPLPSPPVEGTTPRQLSGSVGSRQGGPCVATGDGPAGGDGRPASRSPASRAAAAEDGTAEAARDRTGTGASGGGAAAAAVAAAADGRQSHQLVARSHRRGWAGEPCDVRTAEGGARTRGVAVARGRARGGAARGGAARGGARGGSRGGPCALWNPPQAQWHPMGAEACEVPASAPARPSSPARRPRSAGTCAGPLQSPRRRRHRPQWMPCPWRRR